MPQPVNSSWIRSMLPPLVLAALLTFAFTESITWHPAFLEPSRHAVFRWEKGVWQPLPALPGNVEKLRVSAGGALWAVFWRHMVGNELARLDGASWRTFQAADFGVGGFAVSGGFVLDGEELWAATEKGVLHWDGQHWKTFRDASGGSSIAAAHGQVWVIDDDARLSHFDGAQWTVEKVDLPPGDTTELALTADGTLWIVRTGVFRRDGSAWRPVKPDGQDLKDADLVGTAGNGLWLWDGGQLSRVATDGTLRQFAPAEMGLAPREGIYDVAESAGHTYVATTRGALEFDGAAWRRLPSPPGGVGAVVSIRASYGRLFVVGDIPNPVALRWQILIRSVPLLLFLGFLAVPVWMVRRFKRLQLSRHQHLQQAVAYATGAVPAEFARDERLLVKQSSWWSATVAVGVVIGAAVGYWTMRIFWPAAPTWMFLAIALGLHLMAMLWQTLTRREARPWDPIEPGGSRFDWAPTRRALPASLLVFMLMNVGHFPAWMGDPVLWILYAVLAFIWYKFTAQKLLNAAVRRGDFDGGLKLIRRIHFYNPDGGASLLPRGHILLLAGRYREAESVLRRAMVELRSRAAQAYVLEFLGDALMEQGREEEARRSYEASLAAAPGFRRPYRGLAELALRRGDAARALQHVENILAQSGPARNPLSLTAKSTDDYWSLKAWALAGLGRIEQVPPAVAEAIRHTNPRSAPDLAATYRRLGLAMRAINREAEAGQYLAKARDANPTGRWGSLAKAALAEHSPWRTAR